MLEEKKVKPPNYQLIVAFFKNEAVFGLEN